MTVIVFNGVEIQATPNMKFSVDGDRLNIESYSTTLEWPKPKAVRAKMATKTGSIAGIVRMQFPKIGTTKVMTANSNKTIRAGFYSAGWTAKVVPTNIANEFKVTRVS
jgi:hypothetical protein